MLIERDGRLFVQGAMTMAQAATLVVEGEAVCAKSDCIVDLAEVTAADSSAVAVVLGWLRCSKEAGRSIRIMNPPPSFSSLSALYGVDELLAPFMGLAESKAHDGHA